MSTFTNTPAAQKAGRSKSRATANAEKVTKMNDAAAEPNRTELIKTATRLGVKGASAKNKLELKAAIAAARTKGIVDAVAESAKSGPNAEVTKAAAKAAGVTRTREQRARAQGNDAPKAPTAAEKLAAAPQASSPASTGQITRRTTRGERGLKAKAEATKLGKRGPGRKVTDAELIEYVAKVRREHPETNASDELEYAYWIEKLAVNRDRFNRAWTEASRAA